MEHLLLLLGLVLLVIVRMMPIVWAIVPSLPRITTRLVPAVALGAILIAKSDEAFPPDGMSTGFGSKPDNVTPGGGLGAVNVTSPVYPTTEVPATVRGTDVPCSEDTYEEGTLRA
jgi:hypothetical protein